MRNSSMVVGIALLVSLLSLAIAAPTLAGERELNGAWRGAWVVTHLPSNSNCDGRYTNNEVSGDLVSSDGRLIFERGELGRVDKINLNRRKIEVLVDLVEPVLIPYQDGPFDLYQEALCRVELRIDRPQGGDAEFNAAIAAALERHTAASAAEASAEWNRREREAYPEGYDETLAEYEVWRAAQFDAAVQAEISESLTEAARLMRRIDDDADYLGGFGQGVEHARREYFTNDCDKLLSMSRYSFVDSAPSGSSDAFEEGYEEAQALFFHLERALRLRGCFLAPPG